MNRFNSDYLKGIKERVGEETGIKFGNVRGSRLAAANPVVVTLMLIALASATVFAAHQFKISKSVLEAPTAGIPSAQQIEDPGIYDQSGNPVSSDDIPVLTDQNGDPVYSQSVPEPAAASGVYEGPDYGNVNGFIISFPFGSKEGIYGTVHHDGIDLAADKGTAVLAAAEGTVTEAEFDPKMGNHVVIDHGDGYTTTYAHLQEIAVDIGQSVNAGDQIGTVGASGMATGPCLHLELRLNGEPLDPEDYWE